MIAVFLLLAAVSAASAKDAGQYAVDPAVKAWFDGLRSGKGLCCSFADGVSVADVDWDADGGHYRVRLCRKPVAGDKPFLDCADRGWIVVPDSALVSEPNRLGPAVVWPYRDWDGATQIRCFIPGAQSEAEPKNRSATR